MDEDTTTWIEEDSEEEVSEVSAMPAPMQVPWPAPAPSSNTTSYENVYCAKVEGRLELNESGLLFSPYVASRVPAKNVAPFNIVWSDVAYHEFLKECFKAGYQTYSTNLTLYNLKLGVLPSKEAVFSLQQQDEFDRLRCDLNARGYGAPPPAAEAEPSNCIAETEEDIQREHKPDDCEEHFDEKADGQQAYDMQYTPAKRTEGGDIGQGWSTASVTTLPKSSYFPVRCKNTVGTLVLTHSHIQFLPDSHSAPVKTLPWASFAGKPFYSPWNYPRAQMAIHYYSTQGDKKIGFDIENFEELTKLQDDVRARMRPFKNETREKAYVLPRKPRDNHGSWSLSRSVSKPQRRGGLARKEFSNNKKVAPSPNDVSATEDTTSYEDPISASSVIPLVTTTARRVPYHRDEPRRRILMLFCSYCCIATLTGLTFSILFGYFFGPRRPKEVYVRTQSPYNIGTNYLGTKPPTFAPAPSKRDAWNSDEVSLSQSVTAAPTGAEVATSGALDTESSDEMNGYQPQEEQIGGSIRGSDFDLMTLEPTAVGTINETVRPTLASVTVETANPAIAQVTVDRTTAPSSVQVTPDPTVSQATNANEPASADPTNSPSTLAPTSEQTRSSRSIAELLMENSFDHGKALRTSGTPQQAAYLYMKISGLLDEAPSDDSVVQKYGLTTLYYATGGKDWNDGSASWKDLAASDCLKEYIFCDDSTQQALWIDMPHNNMKGVIPPEIGLLEKLTHINFKDNDLRGTIPTELGVLKNLQYLDLSGNKKLEGSVPEEVRSLPFLDGVNLRADLP